METFVYNWLALASAMEQACETSQTKGMDIKSEDLESYLTQQTLGREDAFGQIFRGHIPATNCYGLKEMDVAIRVSQPRKGEHERDLEMQFNNELILRSLQHRNIIGLIGFSESKERFYLVYEIVQVRSLSEVIDGLTWEQALKVLKGTVSGLAYLHSHPEGPLVHSNICLNNIVVTQEFVPKVIDFRYCVLEGHACTSSSPRYYPSTQEGVATVRSDIFAFGLVALQLITKDSRTAFAVEEGPGVSLHHILDLYIPMFKEKGNFVHESYGHRKESGKLTEMIVDCLKRDSRVNLKSLHKDLIMLSLAR